MRFSHVLPTLPHPVAITLTEPVHPYEKSLIALVVVNSCFLPWAFGGVDPWAQISSLFLATAALIVSLLPRTQGKGMVNINQQRIKMWPRLQRFPVFWAGLVLFAYVGVQSLNPAYEYNLLGIDWWLSPVHHVSWMPAGMRVPFANASPTRWLMVALTTWCTVCALWVGVTRRRTIFTLLGFIAVNAFLFACFGIVQRASGATEVYSVRLVGYPYFFSAIIYKNHAAAFLGLTACISLAVGANLLRKSGRRDRSGAEVLFFLFAVILLLSLILTFSFSGMAIYISAFSGAVLLVAFSYRKKNPGTRARKWSLVTLSVLFVGSFGVAASTGYRDWQEKTRSFFASDAHTSTRMRLLAGRRGLEMFQDRWALGWGAGCFQYGFSKYQAREPELNSVGEIRLRWEHVHNDWLELLIELGVVGVLPIAFIILYWIGKIWHERLWRIYTTIPLLCALIALAAQALIDFPLQNLAVALTAAVLLPLAVRLGELGNRAQPDP